MHLNPRFKYMEVEPWAGSCAGVDDGSRRGTDVDGGWLHLLLLMPNMDCLKLNAIQPFNVSSFFDSLDCRHFYVLFSTLVKFGR